VPRPLKTTPSSRLKGGRTGLVLKQNVHNLKSGKVIDHKYLVDTQPLISYARFAVDQAKGRG